MNFEKLLYESDKESLYNIVIVGAGATGVEMAGAFVEMKREVLPKDYPNIDSSKVNVYLLEGGPNTLPSMSRFSQNYSEKYLRDMGVIVKTNVIVTNYDGNEITLNNGEFINLHFKLFSGTTNQNTLLL